MRGEFFSAQPPPSWEAVLSLPANLTTALVLVDYAAHRQTTPTPWPYQVLARLSESDRARLAAMRSVLAHGTNLRDFLLGRIGAHEVAQREWSALLARLEGLRRGEVTELIILGILSGLEWYREEMEPDPAVEAILQRLGSREPGPDALADPDRRRLGLEALLASWGYRDPCAPLALASDPGAFHEALVRVLAALWEQGMDQAWDEGREELERAVALAGGGALAGTGEELVLRLTGLQPPASGAGLLRQARQISFYPCSKPFFDLALDMDIFGCQFHSLAL